ncbi:hypothetical protein [Sneathiella chinensis]|uniref:Uncharacterized protein n=1 Tax=Sneathiella chinensis TaxID=349750 RepID=A0ABQ5U2X7_9PROT|nr:hypothetical protein [Sneathiella chinensis]GLQ06046.1 hypothetical protein GCM10007924_12670 [Sneathiella chinensis]
MKEKLAGSWLLAGMVIALMVMFSVLFPPSEGTATGNQYHDTLTLEGDSLSGAVPRDSKT